MICFSVHCDGMVMFEFIAPIDDSAYCEHLNVPASRSDRGWYTAKVDAFSYSGSNHNPRIWKRYFVDEWRISDWNRTEQMLKLWRKICAQN